MGCCAEPCGADLPNVDQHALHLQLSKVVLHMPHEQDAHKLGVAVLLVAPAKMQVYGCMGSNSRN